MLYSPVQDMHTLIGGIFYRGVPALDSFVVYAGSDVHVVLPQPAA